MLMLGPVFSARERAALRPSVNTGGLLVGGGGASLARIVMNTSPSEAASMPRR